MANLLDDIREAVREERFVIGLHANQRLKQRKIPAWQVYSSLEDGKLLDIRQDAKPNPVVEMQHVLPDGTEVKVVWAWLAESRTAKLVTVHFFDNA